MTYEARAAVDDVLSFLLGPSSTCGCGPRRLATARLSDDAKDVTRILRGLVPLEKQLDPVDQGDFVTVVARASEALRRAAHRVSVSGVDRAGAALDAKWADMTPAAAAARIARAERSLPPPRRLVQAVMPIVRQRTQAVADRTQRSVAAALGIDLEKRRLVKAFDAEDQAVLDHLMESQALFITDALTGRNAQWGERARRIVRDGVAAGAGSDDIAADLRRTLGPAATLRRQANYWDIIATTFANRARQFGHLSTMDLGGLSEFVFEAVLDEVTSVQCRLLHGRVFSVRAGLERYRQVAASDDPQDVKTRMPWVRTRRRADGETELWVPGARGARQIIGVTRGGAATARDARGGFTRESPQRALERLGVMLPPLHALCRSTVVARV